MKLLENIVKNVPHEMIHPDAEYFAQDNSDAFSKTCIAQYQSLPESDDGDEDIVAYKIATPATGVKHDSGKPRFCLLPLKQVWQVVEVLEFGAKKYAPDNWQKVDNQRERYFNAAQSHLAAWWQGEKKDPETGLSHLAHVVCCVLFLMWGDDNDKNSR